MLVFGIEMRHSIFVSSNMTMSHVSFPYPISPVSYLRPPPQLPEAPDWLSEASDKLSEASDKLSEASDRPSKASDRSLREVLKIE